jgi:hypothetical protein
MKEWKKKNNLRQEINNFLIDWHRYPIDYWWRDKYRVPFGSRRHREMNLIDIAIEYVERVEIQKYINRDNTEPEYEDPNVVRMTQEDIDKDFDELDLSQFNT